MNKGYKLLCGVAAVLSLGAFSSQAQTTPDVTVETYGIFGKGRPTDASKYYFLQSEGDDVAKIKPASEATDGHSIDVEREGQYVYFKLGGTNKYLKLTSVDNKVKWLDGKDSKAKWKEVAPLQTDAGGDWHSYVAADNESLYLRHAGYVMFADGTVNPRTTQANMKVFIGDATWVIQGGRLIPPAGTPNSAAYGRKQLQTYSVSNTVTDKFYIGQLNGKEKIVDVTAPANGKAQILEVRYKPTMKVAIIVDTESGKYLTTDASGNVTLTANEQPGSYWAVTSAQKTGLGPEWFSFQSQLVSGAFLRHTGYVLYAQKKGPGTNPAAFDGDATWKVVNK